MRSLLIIFYVSFISFTGNALDLGQEDKQKHVGASAILNTTVYTTIRVTSKVSKTRAFLISSLITLAVGGAKELTDVKADREDMQANIIGILLTLPIIRF